MRRARMVGRQRVAKRKPVLRIEPVLVLGRGPAWHRKAVIGKDFAGARDMGEHPVEDAPAGAVVVHTKFEKLA